MKHVKKALQQELEALNKAGEALTFSYEKCSRIGVHPDLSNEELESFEALTGRFARLSDIIVQKMLRYFDVIDLEETGTVRDRINRAEKKGVIKTADDFIQIRLLRNEIAHEYKSEIIESSPRQAAGNLHRKDENRFPVRFANPAASSGECARYRGSNDL